MDYDFFFKGQFTHPPTLPETIAISATIYE